MRWGACLPALVLLSLTAAPAAAGGAAEALPLPRLYPGLLLLEAGADHDGLEVRRLPHDALEMRWRLDGLDATDPVLGGPGLRLPPEWVESAGAIAGDPRGTVALRPRRGTAGWQGGAWAWGSGAGLTGRRLSVAGGPAAVSVTRESAVVADGGIFAAGPLDAGGAHLTLGVSPAWQVDSLTRELRPVAPDGSVGRPLDAGRWEGERRSSAVRSLLHVRAPLGAGRLRLGHASDPETTRGPTGTLRAEPSALDGRSSRVRQQLWLGWSGRAGAYELDLGYRSHLVSHRRLPAGPLAAAEARWRVYPAPPPPVADLPVCEVGPGGSPASSACAVRGWQSGGLGSTERGRAHTHRVEARLGRTFEAAGSHRLGLGLQAERGSHRLHTGLTGGRLDFELDPRTVLEQRYGTVESGRFVPAPEVGRRGEGVHLGVELLDRWRPRRQLTVSGRLGWQRQWLWARPGTARLAVGTLLPAVTVAWTPGKPWGRLWAAGRVDADRLPLWLASGALTSPRRGRRYLVEGEDLTPRVFGERLLVDEEGRRWAVDDARREVSPALRAATSGELVAGWVSPEVAGWRLQATLRHHARLRGIEDVRVGDRRVVANPGARRDPHPEVRTSPSPTRRYTALELEARAMLSKHWQLLAALTLSRLAGSTPGVYSPELAELAPYHSSQFDGADLLLNAEGPLPGDRPVRTMVALHGGLGTRVRVGVLARSAAGRPRLHLAAHPSHGAARTLVLPRGSAGRTDWVHQIDLRLAVRIGGGRRTGLEAVLDVSNLLNLQAAVAVDDVWTHDVVRPVVGGRLPDIEDAEGRPTLRTLDGDLARKNPDFGKPTRPEHLQPPRALRLGLRLTF